MHRFSTLLTLVALLALGVFGAAAQFEDPEPAEDAAYVRVAHLSPDTPPVQVFIDGVSSLSGLRYGSVTRWIDLAPGSYEFAVGTTSDISAAQISGIALDLAPGQFVTLAAVGSAEGETLKGIAIEEDYTRISTGQARVTALHALEGAPLVDVTASGQTFVEFLAFPGTFTAPDGTTNDGVTTEDVPAGTGLTVTAVNSGAAVIDDPEFELVANTNYFVAVVGTPDAPDVVVAESDQSVYFTRNFAEGEARVRVAHLSAETAPVTIFVDGQVVLSGLRFNSASRFLPLQPGTYEIAVSPNSNIANAVIGPVELTFEDGVLYTIAAITGADGAATPVVIEDFIGAEAGQASVTLFHAIPGGPVIDVAAGETLLVNGLAFAGTFPLPAGGFNDGITEVGVAAGETTLDILPVGGSDPILSATEELVDGNYYLVAVIVGADGNPTVVVFDTDPAVDFTPDDEF